MTAEITFVAVLPHDAGVFSAYDVEITGSTKEELRIAAERKCVGGRYVSRIVAVVDGEPVTVYRESSGWALKDPFDVTQLIHLGMS